MDADVVVVGYGPVGMVTAALVARLGHRVLVLERYPGLYNLPRAAIFDDETMRTFAGLGVAERLLPGLRVQRSYEWRNGDGELLIEHDFAERGRSGWAEWYMMYQPDLEDELDRTCRSLPGLVIRHASPVTAVTEEDSEVRLTVETGTGPRTVTARYVVACDGGNSFVRAALGIDQEDYGFSEPWMVCDFRLLRPVELPPARQIGDPRQPTSIISLGPRHHRFSFMLDSAEAFETERHPELVWTRVADYLTSADADLIRVATYTFRSLMVRRWRHGRILLAGDAAHQMPPFLGQGMCSGIRDAQNLAFKLDLVLRGRHTPDLLDTYQVEREPHVRAVIEKGIELGRAHTIREPAAAAERDRGLLARRATRSHPEKIVFPGLHNGYLAESSGPGRGELSVQGVVDDGTRRGPLDQVVGQGFQLIAPANVIADLERSGSLAHMHGTRLRLVPLTREPGSGILDVEDTYHSWLAELGCAAVLVRPDFYVYGTATDVTDAERLVRQLTTDTAPSRVFPALA